MLHPVVSVERRERPQQVPPLRQARGSMRLESQRLCEDGCGQPSRSQIGAQGRNRCGARQGSWCASCRGPLRYIPTQEQQCE